MVRTAGIVEYQRIRSKEEIEAEEKDDENRRKMLLWLSELDFDKEHDTIFAKRHPDTGKWLVESPEFGDWINAKKSSMLWCYGNPGVGKSVLASIVLEEISTKYALDSGVGLAFVYFNYKNQDVQNPRKILSTIMKQLARQKRVVPDQLKQFYRKYYRDADFPSDEKLEAQLSELMKTFEQVYMVMDAMDELEDRKKFLSVITRLAQDFESSINLKIFVTSRREKDIEIHFNRCKVPTIQIEAAKVDTDIAAFVHDQLERWDENFTEFPIDQTLRDEIKHALTSKSNGMFLWVKFQLDYIYGQPSISDVRTALSSLPNTMSETYIRILSKIDRQIPARKKIAQHALMWVVGAARSLTVKELVLAVSIKPGCRSAKDLEKYPIETVIQACENLLTVEDDIVRFCHFSVFEFLSTTAESECGEYTGLFQKYRAFINDKHAELAEICIQFMLFEESLGYKGDWYFYEDEVPFASYAVYFFDHHIRKIMHMHLPDCLTHIIDELLDSKAEFLAVLYNNRCSVYSKSINTIDPLGLCLMLGILDAYTRSNNFPLSRGDLTQYDDALLHFAARGGSVSAIQKLLDHGYSINMRDVNDRYPLDYAAEMGYLEVLEFLLGKGADVNAQGGIYGNALQAAAFHGHEAIVRTLLECGADVNAQDRPYGNALQVAIYGGHETIVQTLLERDADINAQGGIYGNALQAAACEGNEAIVRTLLERGADVNAQGGIYGNALQAAAYHGHEAIVRTLLERGADVNAQGGRYGNALQAAACESNETIVRTLLERGADVNAQDGPYGNALQAATYHGHEAIVQTLLERGADVNAQGGDYGNALQAAACESNGAIVRTLLKRGADVNAQGGRYGNALQAATYGGHETIVQTLLDRGADVNAQGGIYGNALQAATYDGYETIVQTLLERGADVNAQGGIYGNALQAATYDGYETIVRTLLERGADVNAQGGIYGNTLQAAIYGGHETIVQNLLERGADVNAQGGDYGNALQAAAYKGNETILQALLERGADVNAQGGPYGNALRAAHRCGHKNIVQMLKQQGPLIQ